MAPGLCWPLLLPSSAPTAACRRPSTGAKAAGFVSRPCALVRMPAMGALRAKSASTSAVAPRSLPIPPLSRPTLVGASGRRMLACRAQAAPNKPNQPQPRDQVKARCVPEGVRACAMRCSSGDVGASRLAARLPALDAMRLGLVRPLAIRAHTAAARPCLARAGPWTCPSAAPPAPVLWATR